MRSGNLISEIRGRRSEKKATRTQVGRGKTHAPSTTCWLIPNKKSLMAILSPLNVRVVSSALTISDNHHKRKREREREEQKRKRVMSVHCLQDVLWIESKFVRLDICEGSGISHLTKWGSEQVGLCWCRFIHSNCICRTWERVKWSCITFSLSIASVARLSFSLSFLSASLPFDKSGRRECITAVAAQVE